jgi:hypothetical protein
MRATRWMWRRKAGSSRSGHFWLDPLTFQVSCRRSFGYLYLCATWSASLERKAIG